MVPVYAQEHFEAGTLIRGGRTLHGSGFYTGVPFLTTIRSPSIHNHWTTEKF